MTLEEHKKKIEMLLNDSSGLAEDALLSANDALALRQLNTQELGVGSIGTYEGYTPEYKRDRVKYGVQTSVVDFTVTGSLWRSVQTELIKSTPRQATVEIKARDSANQAKINGAFKKRGNILEPTREEQEINAQVFQTRQLNRFNE